MFNSFKILIKLFFYITIPLSIIIYADVTKQPIKWIGGVLYVLGFSWIRQDFISEEKKYLNYLKDYFEVKHLKILKKAIQLLYNREFENLNEFCLRNLSELSLKFLSIQASIVIDKNYNHISELLSISEEIGRNHSIRNRNEDFADLNYLIYLCYKENNELEKSVEVKNKLDPKDAFLFKKRIAEIKKIKSNI